MPTPRDLRATYRPSEEERCVVLAGELGHDEGMRYSGERGVWHGLLKEVRDDDARLFNDHHNRFDVMDSAMVTQPDIRRVGALVMSMELLLSNERRARSSDVKRKSVHCRIIS